MRCLGEGAQAVGHVRKLHVQELTEVAREPREALARPLLEQRRDIELTPLASSTQAGCSRWWRTWRPRFQTYMTHPTGSKALCPLVS